MKGGDGERGSAARPRAPWKRGGEGETERRGEDFFFFFLKTENEKYKK